MVAACTTKPLEIILNVAVKHCLVVLCNAAKHIDDSKYTTHLAIVFEKSSYPQSKGEGQLSLCLHRVWPNIGPIRQKWVLTNPNVTFASVKCKWLCNVKLP